MYDDWPMQDPLKGGGGVEGDEAVNKAAIPH
jgi:hypothetical protein